MDVGFHAREFGVTVYNQLIITYRNIALIYNPIAGSIRRRVNFPDSVLRTLRQHGHEAGAVPTEGPRTAAAIARRSIEQGADLILAAGGDGTINEVAQGVIGTDVPLALLPGGTANVLGTEMGLGKSLRRAAALIGECEPRRIAVGRIWVNGGADNRYFLLMAGVGLDAHIVYGLNLKLKSRIGKLAYWLSGANTFLRYRLAEFSTAINAHSIQTSFALASRVRNYGGDFEIARNVHLLDEDFEVV
ncbi:MAG: diacylglycerol kinase family protein, partial [Acidobacteria bacterium]|nr:diacylglycerol kinase family protein [Acidobacteriota bacterium]